MVYVDHLEPAIISKRWPFRWSCHLFADSDVELHNFAAAIGLRREWFQASDKLDHYDLTCGKRKIAIRKGAIEVDRKFVVSRFKQL